MTTENAGIIQAGGRFQKGQSGNPAGKPRGTRHRATLAAEVLLDGEAEVLTRKAVDLALQGDCTALRLCMDRIVPLRRDRPISFEMPEIESVADAAGAMASVLKAVASGDITLMEAADVARLVEIYIRTLEMSQFEARLRAIEEKVNEEGATEEAW